jgi:hypothetical protein
MRRAVQLALWHYEQLLRSNDAAQKISTATKQAALYCAWRRFIELWQNLWTLCRVGIPKEECPLLSTQTKAVTTVHGVLQLWHRAECKKQNLLLLAICKGAESPRKLAVCSHNCDSVWSMLSPTFSAALW